MPIEVTREQAGFQAQAILDIFDRFSVGVQSTLEVGGSPGQYLAYIHRRTGCDCAVLDFSPVGCAYTRANFEQLNIPVTIYERDLFDSRGIGKFDLVYSLGLIEHFEDFGAAAEAHARLVKPGGLLMLGMPNLSGVNGWLARLIDSDRYFTHNIASMRLDRWDSFEAQQHLQRLFRGPIGGFEPRVFAATEKPVTPSRLVVRAIAHGLVRSLSDHGAWLRRYNHAWFSGYLFGVWRVRPAADELVSG